MLCVVPWLLCNFYPYRLTAR